jgi:RNA polymerase sigma-70 factor (ECF subfamily)
MNLNNLSDEELMVMYQSGAEDAFQILYRRHSEKIYGFLRGRVWNNERAAELFQDAFLKMHRSKHLYNKSLPALPWIFSVTRSVLIDGLRADKRAKRDAEFVCEESDTAPMTTPEIAGLLSRLPENQRHAVELRFVDEKTFEEVAETLNTTSQNARKIISRAVSKLKGFASEGEKP